MLSRDRTTIFLALKQMIIATYILALLGHVSVTLMIFAPGRLWRVIVPIVLIVVVMFRG